MIWYAVIGDSDRHTHTDSATESSGQGSNLQTECNTLSGMCAVTFETAATIADVEPVMAVVRGVAAPALLEPAVPHLLAVVVPLSTSHCGCAS